MIGHASISASSFMNDCYIIMVDSGMKINRNCLFLYCAQRGNKRRMENKFRDKILKFLPILC